VQRHGRRPGTLDTACAGGDVVEPGEQQEATEGHEEQQRLGDRRGADDLPEDHGELVAVGDLGQQVQEHVGGCHVATDGGGDALTTPATLRPRAGTAALTEPGATVATAVVTDG
jgi:hypothetical protein